MDVLTSHFWVSSVAYVLIGQTVQTRSLLWPESKSIDCSALSLIVFTSEVLIHTLLCVAPHIRHDLLIGRLVRWKEAMQCECLSRPWRNYTTTSWRVHRLAGNACGTGG